MQHIITRAYSQFFLLKLIYIAAIDGREHSICWRDACLRTMRYMSLLCYRDAASISITVLNWNDSGTVILLDSLCYQTFAMTCIRSILSRYGDQFLT